MRRSLQVVVLLAAIATVAVGVGAFALMTDSPGDTNDPPTTDPPTVDGDASVEQFESDAAFESYVRAAQRDSGGFFGGGGAVTFDGGREVAVETTDASVARGEAGGAGGASDRWPGGHHQRPAGCGRRSQRFSFCRGFGKRPAPSPGPGFVRLRPATILEKTG